VLTGEQLDHRLIVEALRAELCLRYAPAPHPRPRAERAAPSQGGLLRRLLTLVPLPRPPALS
jgi:hypothetical protein